MRVFSILKGLRAGLLAVVFAHGMAAGAAEFFVAPNGTPQGDGSRERPWDLQTALNQPAAVKPGDTIWLRGGLYTNAKGDYNSKLRGTPDAPIIVRNYRGERATLKAHLGIGYGKWWPAAYSWYWGLEITNREIHPNRNGIDVASSRDRRPGIKIINCVIHDCGSCGIGFWAGAADSEVHGCLIYNCGYDGQARGSHRKARSYRGHGHGMYIQNEKGFKLIKNNVSFRQFGNGLSPHTTKAPRNNITLEQNAVFNSGEYSLIAPFQKNIEFQYGTVGRNGRMIRNCTYVPGGVRGSGIVAFGNHCPGQSLRHQPAQRHVPARGHREPDDDGKHDHRAHPGLPYRPVRCRQRPSRDPAQARQEDLRVPQRLRTGPRQHHHL